ncbi:Kinesin-related motor protein [Komagataella phaffii CBS 7435]|uniref:Kinesin-like protein n=2 Tax=Komagataella phaffii TaxID=460519 RepID=C4R035_KOMPG|nr:Kinesin-related motor protein involved in mitotic spindle positioning [Komagataella phaffii GS115]AOA62525.1 GQ67_00277T0 [Komagataella phaffii]CAH2448640.1 Kinesin-related motor protein [Komagataella phaffii CBS 7435]AOA67471.1 GQ68_01112T0 [Komagataella phaffii GS115]CAY68859.1 Kinesin-related motor protein involved in mitotic spindle positioning [Komagataella phaffii GS115]CCA38734.1 Kinesin-related motor protein [Komagataella phaffii CBS 7435]
MSSNVPRTPPLQRRMSNRSSYKSPMESPLKMMKTNSSKRSPIKTSSADYTKVVVRFRPSIFRHGESQEIVDDNLALGKKTDSQLITIEPHQSVYISGTSFSGRFTFDRVFGPETSQTEVFDYSINETVNDFCNGYNGTIFAYGQTGSGKTHTMLGNMDSPSEYGVVPRVADKLFEQIANGSPSSEYTVSIGVLEIYMEQLRDLLNPDNSNNLCIRDSGALSEGVTVQHLETRYVSSKDELLGAVILANKLRTTGVTDANADSSRSHAIFQIKLAQRSLDDGVVKISTLFLVDLAGSERIARTGATGQTLEEAKKINTSLSALGNVINALTDGQSTYIPYRDSKLTRILQESLGGNARTTLIVNCSPDQVDEGESVSALRFGARAKRIQNKARVNQEIASTELQKRLVTLESENAALIHRVAELEEQSKLKEIQQEATNTVTVDATKIKRLESSVSQLAIRLKQNEAITEELTQELDRARAINERRKIKIEQLEKAMQAQHEDMIMETDKFANKLSYLKARITSVKRMNQTQVPYNEDGLQPAVNIYESPTTLEENEEGLESLSINVCRSPVQFSNKAGLHLNIVKPMRGGSAKPA